MRPSNFGGSASPLKPGDLGERGEFAVLSAALSEGERGGVEGPSLGEEKGEEKGEEPGEEKPKPVDLGEVGEAGPRIGDLGLDSNTASATRTSCRSKMTAREGAGGRDTGARAGAKGGTGLGRRGRAGEGLGTGSGGVAGARVAYGGMMYSPFSFCIPPFLYAHLGPTVTCAGGGEESGL